MNRLEWDGSQLAAECVALTVLTGVSTSEHAPTLIAAAASAEDRRFIIRPERLGGFLRAHRQYQIACFDAGELHWSLEPYLFTHDREAWNALWVFSRDSRLFDVRLFHQLLFLGGSGGYPPPRGLAELARFYGVITPDRFDRIGSYPIGPQPGIAGPAGDQSLDEVARAADLIYGIYREQKAGADKNVALLGVEPDIERRFGTLTIGIQVQGAIALGRATRNGLRIRDDVVPKLQRLCSAVHRESARLLVKQQAARKCFGGSGEEIELTRSGLPKFDKVKLRRWLEQTISSNPSLYNIPLEPPRTPDGEISTIPDHWGHLALVRPELRAWSRLWTAAVLAKTLRDRDRHGAVHPRYEVVPAIRSIGPNLEQLRRLEPPPVFAAPAGQTLLVCRLPDLGLRCLAENIERRGEVSRLGSILRMGYDPVRYAAWTLSSPERGVSADDEVDPGAHDDEAPDPVELWKKLCKELARTPDPSAIRRADPILGWLDFEEAGGQREGFDRWVALARALLHAVPRGLGPEHARSVLDAGKVEFDLGVVERHYRSLVESVFPELAPFVEDVTLEILPRKLGCDPDDIEGLMLDGGPDWTAAALRKLIDGRTRVPDLFARLRNVNRNDDLRGLMEADEGCPRLYRAIFGEPAVVATGRVRGGVYFTEARASAFLDLADDVLKWVMYRLVGPPAAFDLVACVGEEFVLRVDDKLLADDVLQGETVRRIEELVTAAAGEILVRFPPRCEVNARQDWLGTDPAAS